MVWQVVVGCGVGRGYAVDLVRLPTFPAKFRSFGKFNPCVLQIQQEKKYGAGKGYAVDLGRLDYVAFAKAFGATGGPQSLSGGGALCVCECCRGDRLCVDVYTGQGRLWFLSKLWAGCAMGGLRNGRVVDGAPPTGTYTAWPAERFLRCCILSLAICWLHCLPASCMSPHHQP